MESTENTEAIPPPAEWTKEALIGWLIEQAQELNGGKKIAPSDDLFEQGFDRSVQIGFNIASWC